MLDPLDHELGDPVAAPHLVPLARIGVDQKDPQLVAVAGVDEAGGVEAGDAMAQGEAAAGLHEPGEARRNGDGDARGYQRPSTTGGQLGVLPRHQVGAGVVDACIRRQRQLGVEAADGDLQHDDQRTQPPLASAPMLVWMDLEMTGLDPERDVIVEIASLITDDDLQLVAEGPDLVVHQPAEKLQGMADVVVKMHTASGLLDAITSSTIDLDGAGAHTLEFIKAHVPEPRSVPLCGNSIGTDRRFLARYLPAIDEYLHYRSVDVSTVKELCRRWYPEVFAAAPDKAGGHRALDDIRESVEELRYYRGAIFKGAQPGA